MQFRTWLEELALIDSPAPTRNKDVKELEVMLNKIVGVLPDFQQFYGSMGERPGLVRDEDGKLFGAPREGPPHVDQTPSGPGSSGTSPIEQALEQATRSDSVLDPGGDIPATKRARTSRSGPALRHAHAPTRTDISWMEGDTILINTAHATYLKATEKKVLEYHHLLAAAVAMLREVPTAEEKIDVLEKFMNEWGKL